MELKNLHGRKARMLLVYPDYTDRDCARKMSGGNYSEGLASISAVLKQGGHHVELLHLLNLHTDKNHRLPGLPELHQVDKGSISRRLHHLRKLSLHARAG